MYQLKTETKEIDGTEFSVTQFPAMKALEVMGSLQKMAAGANPNTQLAQAAAGGTMSKQMVLDLLACTTALLREPKTKLVGLTSQGAIDEVFSGRLRTLFRVIEFAIEVNFGDFKEGSEDSAPLTLTQDQ